ncbi:MAG TPA: hypothetical protein VHB74_12665 [Devosia sp.]|nr:hypothetical protein [Devosia sp.]
MSVVRSAVAAVEVTIAVVGVAVAISRHPMVRAGLRAMPPALKDAAADAALEAAYRAGAAARRIVPKSIIG